MSKASEYAKADQEYRFYVESKAPKQPAFLRVNRGETLRYAVADGYGRLQCNTAYVLEPKDACDFAAWILATFGEEPAK